ncbi:hypothetical protein GIB67_011722 [Kingdonia uniflora]|uniref:PORR domain-containing protein n=1 Tax=Kingdonia uniflora TaxID=39325 RepID=A0A7J7LUP7_9MAGN|nr:hypothetical protein GIB67_011722 [Kingdonia uniflora]
MKIGYYTTNPSALLESTLLLVVSASNNTKLKTSSSNTLLIFEIYPHPVQRILFCRLTRKAILQIEEGKFALNEQIGDAVTYLRKLPWLSNTGRVQLEHVRIAPCRVRVTGRLQVLDISSYDLWSIEARKRLEKRGLVMIHELLLITVEKKHTLERIVHFRIVMDLPKKDEYWRGDLVKPNELYFARRKLAELIKMSSRKYGGDRKICDGNFRRDRDHVDRRSFGRQNSYNSYEHFAVQDKLHIDGKEGTSYTQIQVLLLGVTGRDKKIQIRSWI